MKHESGSGRGPGLCLSFSNTLHRRAKTDDLRGRGDLISWGVGKGLVAKGDSNNLDRQLADNQAEEALLARARELREAVYGVFSSIAQGTDPPVKDLWNLNKHLKEALRASVIAKTDDGYSWKWDEGLAPEEVVLGEVARSAADLLTSPMVRNVCACAGRDQGCGWLGLDKTKNHTRRWCSMKACGNRAKAKRYYDTHKGSTVGVAPAIEPRTGL